MNLDYLNKESGLIQLYGEVDEAFYLGFMAQIANKRSNQPLIIDLNSGGGDWEYGIGVYNRLKAHNGPITIRVWGYAMSMASIILQAADNRLIAPYSTIMVHDVSDATEGSMEHLETNLKLTKKLCDHMYKIYMERTGHPVSFWRQKCKKDYYLTAKEAVGLNLADAIIEKLP